MAEANATLSRRGLLTAMLGLIVWPWVKAAPAPVVVAHTTDCKALALRPPLTQCPPFRHRRPSVDLATLRRMLEARHDAS
jgi:hypothetical protein